MSRSSILQKITDYILTGGRRTTAVNTRDLLTDMANSYVIGIYDTSSNWTANNPILETNTIGIESDGLKFKIGDGVTAWNSLPYANSGGGGSQSLQDVINVSNVVTESELDFRDLISGNTVLFLQKTAGGYTFLFNDKTDGFTLLNSVGYNGINVKQSNKIDDLFTVDRATDEVRVNELKMFDPANVEYETIRITDRILEVLTPVGGVIFSADNSGQIGWQIGNSLLAIIRSTSITSNRTLDFPDKDGTIAVLTDLGGATSTEIGYLSGSTSNIQNQINNLAIGIGGWKSPARVLCSTNINISSPGSTLDGVTFSSGDVNKRVVLNNQTTGSQNGVYNWNGASVPMTRTTDCSTGDYSQTGVLGMVITIEEGTKHDQMWLCTNDAPITIGSTALNFIYGNATTYTSSNGITLTGNNFTIDAAKVPYFAALSTGLVKWNGSAWVFDTSTYLTSINSSQVTTALGFTPENSANKDASGGYVGLTLFKINFKNTANTFTSFFTNSNTASRNYTFPDKDGTVAMTSDITGTNSGTNTGDETASRIAAINHGTSAKTTLVDADEVTGQDSANSFSLIRTTWTNVKSFLKTYFDTIYLSLSGGSLTGSLNQAKGTNIASASTTNIGAATGNYIHITGTTTITAFDSIQAGTERVLIFDGSLTLTYNATSLILPGASNIQTQANDVAIMRSEGSGNWRCVSYNSAMGAYTDYTPSFTGFSVAPTSITARYFLSGKMCTVWYTSSAGTSNATTLTITLPFNASSSASQYFISVQATNSGTAATSPGMLVTRTSSNIADVYLTAAAGAWTANGSKNIRFVITYEIQ